MTYILFFYTLNILNKIPISGPRHLYYLAFVLFSLFQCLFHWLFTWLSPSCHSVLGSNIPYPSVSFLPLPFQLKNKKIPLHFIRLFISLIAFATVAIVELFIICCFLSIGCQLLKTETTSGLFSVTTQYFAQSLSHESIW